MVAWQAGKCGTLALLALTVTGCHHAKPELLPAFVEPTGASLSDQQRAYREAGELAFSAAGDLALKPSPTPSQLTELDAKCGPAIEKLLQAQRMSSRFGFEPRDPFVPNNARTGYVMIGRVLTYRIQKAFAKKDFDQAASIFIHGTWFAFDVANGDVTDALVGLPIADELRKAFAPVLPQMGAGQLGQLHENMKSVITRLPDRRTTVENERAEQQFAMQRLQDLLLRGHIDDKIESFGPAARTSLRDLAKHTDSSDPAIHAFFAGMDDDSKAEIAWLGNSLPVPSSKRQPEPVFKVGSKRPWTPLSKELFQTGETYLWQVDETNARTSLLLVEALVLLDVKVKGSAPTHLPPMNDPFTGLPLLYVPKGRDFLLYSAGSDGVDNGGETDETYSRPDLLLEDGRR